MSDHTTTPFTEYQQYTLEPMPEFPEGFTYMDGYDHAPVGETYVLMSDAIAALAAQATAHEAALAAFREHEGCDAAGLEEGYEQGVSDERKRIRAGVEAMMPENGNFIVRFIDLWPVIDDSEDTDAAGTETHVNRADHPPYSREES